MSTVVAVDVHSLQTSLRSLILDLGQTSVLPGILDGVGEDDLITSDVKAAIPLVVEVDSRWANGVIEDILAPLEPEVGTKELGSHGLNWVGYLEPAELGTNLP